MAEKEKKDEKGGKKKRLHLHEVRSTQAHDGSIVHHHVYKDSQDSDETMPERGPMATSSSPEEAGQHVAEQFGMNQGGDAGAAAEPGAEAPQGQAPPPPDAGGGGILG
jgi:hypothetical protein